MILYELCVFILEIQEHYHYHNLQVNLHTKMSVFVNS